MDLAAYAERIGYRGPLRPDFETLRALHRAHMGAIPYENLDVQLRRPVTTAPAAAFEKLVRARRGGWCYEMNGTFGLVLEAIGFSVTRLAGDGSGHASHLVLRVEIDGRPVIADVGFADGPIEPYPLIAGAFVQNGYAFNVGIIDPDHWRLNNHPLGMTPGFLAGPPDEPGLAAMCDQLQNAPSSPFVQNAVVVGRTPEGFLISLVGRVLRLVRPDGVERSMVDSADHYVETLRTRFALDLPEAAGLWPQICARHEEVLREQAARKAAPPPTD